MNTFIRIGILIFACSFSLNAQTLALKGELQDGNKSPLIGAVVVALNAKDSTLLSYSVSDLDGKFELLGLPKADIDLQITYIGFGTIQRFLTLDGSEKVTNLDIITMVAEGKMLDAVVVTGEYVPIRVTKDTLEYNADAFKTQPNAVVEDLLKKLPGVEVEADGSIKVQGETILNITVDGKEFFGKDPKMASKNLPANAIKKIQVFDKKSKTAEFTGVDDGLSEKTINLELRDDKKSGYFGNVMGGYGTDDRYEAKSMINRFDKQTQISFIGSANNLNNAGVDAGEYFNATGQGGSSRGGNRVVFGGDSNIPLSFGPTNSGEIKSLTLGLNMNHQFGAKNKFNLSYFLANSNTLLLQNGLTNTFLPTRNQINSYFDENRTKGLAHIINSSVDIKIDSTSEMTLTGSLAIKDSNAASNRQDTTSLETGAILNTNNQNRTSTANTDDVALKLNYRKRLAKAGRSFTIDGEYGNNAADNANRILSEIYNDLGELNQFRSVFQRQDQINNSFNYNVSGSYTEPLSLQTSLVLTASNRNNNSDIIKDFFDFPPDNITLETKNEILSRNFDNKFVYNKVGLSLRTRNINYTANGGVDFQNSNLKAIPNVGAVIDRNFNYFLPKLNVEFEKINIRINYNTSVREPSMDQLQPILDNSDPLNTYQGNPNLVPEYRHNLRLGYNFFDRFNFRGLFTNLRLGYTKNRITTATIVDNLGIRTRTPLNTENEKTASLSFNLSSPINKWKSKYRIGLNSNLTDGINFIQGIENSIQRWSHGVNFTFENKSKDKFDASINTRLSTNSNIYKTNEALNTSFTNQTYTGYLAVFLGKSWTLDSKLDYYLFGAGSFDEATNIKLLQSSISKGFANNKWTVKLRVFDLLNQNQGVERSASETFISETISNTIGRYFMGTVTYNLNALGGSSQNTEVIRRG